MVGILLDLCIYGGQSNFIKGYISDWQKCLQLIDDTIILALFIEFTVAPLGSLIVGFVPLLIQEFVTNVVDIILSLL